jgi:hypothetical protein
MGLGDIGGTPALPPRRWASSIGGTKNRAPEGRALPLLLIGGASGLLYAVVGGTQHALQQGTTSEGAAFLLPTVLYLLATLGLFGFYLLLLVRCGRGVWM